MLLPRIAVTALLLLGAFVLQVAVFARLPWPAVAPDLVLLVVIGLALVHGPLAGAVTGFAAGMILDLAPPADTVAGRSALVFCIVGYAVGLLRKEAEGSVVATLAVTVAAVVVATGGTALLGALMGDPRVTWDALSESVPVVAAYDAALGPFVVPLVMVVARRVEPSAARR